MLASGDPDRGDAMLIHVGHSPDPDDAFTPALTAGR
jgi:hypothetical protein